MTLSDVSIKNPVFAWMLMAGMLLFGYICFTRMGISQMPDVDFPVVNVSIGLPNASPAIMESDVADPVEDAVLGVEGVQEVQTTCTQGNANISVQLDISRDVNVAVQDVQTAVFQVQRHLPKNIDPPVIRKFNPNSSPIIWFAVTAETPLTTKDLMVYCRDHLKDRFTNLPGVANVFLGGFVDRQININVDNNKLVARQLTADDIITTIQRQHAEVPAGSLETAKTQYQIRSMGEATSVEELSNLPILYRGGAPNYVTTRIKDVAQVEDGLATITRISRLNGTPSVGLGLVMQSGYNAVEVGNSAKKRMEEVQKQLPKGYHMIINFDTTTFVKDNVMELELTILLSALLTGLVCYLFLGSWSSTFNVFLAIPTSLFGTFIVMYFFGFSLNTFTLLALTLSIGVVVDDAIMVLENIVRHQERGEDMVVAALKGSREVTFAAMATSVAIVAIFLPIAFMQGIIGKFFFQFGVAISGAVLISLLEAITLTPMRCSQFVHVPDETKGFNHFVSTNFKKLSALYSRILGWCLVFRAEKILTHAKNGEFPHLYGLGKLLFLARTETLETEVQAEMKDSKYSLKPILGLLGGLAVLALVHAAAPGATKGSALVLLVGALFYLFKERHFLFAHLFYDHRWWIVFGSFAIFFFSLTLTTVIKKETVPATDQSVFIANLKLPVDSSIQNTDGIAKQCEDILRKRSEIKNLYVAVGGFGGNATYTALMFVTMKPKGERPVVDETLKGNPKKGVPDQKIHGRLTQAEFMQVCRQLLTPVSPALQVSMQDLSMRGWSTGRGYGVEFIVTGPEWDKLAGFVEEIKKKMKDDPKLTDVDNNYLTGQPEIEVIPDRGKAILRGVNMDNLGAVIGTMIGGYTFQGSYYHEGGHQNSIFIRVPESQRLTPDAINHLYIRNNRGELVPISAVATLKQVNVLQQITRDNRQRAVYFYANPAPGFTGQQATEEAMSIAKGVLPEGYNADLSGTSKSNTQSGSQLWITMLLGVVVAYMVLASQFNSFLHPITILLALPFSVTGAFAALLATGESLNIYSMIGMILLLGLVKKNSIMLVDFTNQRREQGMKVQEALMAACPVRLRPILMTTFATMAGALPAAMALGPGAELRQPMAVAIIGGILISTLLTLVVVPCAYSLMEGWERQSLHHFDVDEHGNVVAIQKKPVKLLAKIKAKLTT